MNVIGLCKVCLDGTKPSLAGADHVQRRRVGGEGWYTRNRPIRACFLLSPRCGDVSAGAERDRVAENCPYGCFALFGDASGALMGRCGGREWWRAWEASDAELRAKSFFALRATVRRVLATK